MEAVYLALLRRINVGGNNKPPMSGLRDLFVTAGCRDVRTYIQSGNVILRADPRAVASLPDAMTAHIAERFGFRVPVLVRTAAQIDDVIRHTPFVAEGRPPRHSTSSSLRTYRTHAASPTSIPTARHPTGSSRAARRSICDCQTVRRGPS